MRREEGWVVLETEDEMNRWTEEFTRAMDDALDTEERILAAGCGLSMIEEIEAAQGIFDIDVADRPRGSPPYWILAETYEVPATLREEAHLARVRCLPAPAWKRALGIGGVAVGFAVGVWILFRRLD